MLSKIIKQANIDHFSKWFERAEKIVIVDRQCHCAQCFPRLPEVDAGQQGHPAV